MGNHQIAATEIGAAVDEINTRNAHTTTRADAAAAFVVALIVGILGAMLLVHYLLPCDGAALCMAAIITPTRIPPLQRLSIALRAWRLRMRITSLEFDLDCLKHDLDALPARMQAYQQLLDELHIEAIDCDLATRSH